MLGETRGNWTGSAIGTTREERNWALTAMGNWASRDIDLDGSGIDFAEDNLDPDLATRYSNAWFATACLTVCRLQFIRSRLPSDKDHLDSRRDRLRFQRQTRESWHTRQ
ncbi:MAG: hypothetical protein KIT54_10110 [Phycisphaeraceae bacterium]|nr:hypothetical protein [Phycisphaeraceae bacterium]